MANTQTYDCLISNPTQRRRVIHSGVGENGGQVIAIDPGQSVRAILADFIFDRMKVVKKDLVVEKSTGKGKGGQLFDEDAPAAEKPRVHDMRKGHSLKAQPDMPTETSAPDTTPRAPRPRGRPRKDQH